MPTGELVSIVVVTFNNLVFTRLCLESLLANTGYPAYEVIVVDNGSSDGTPVYLDALSQQHPHVRVIYNERNLGFAPANNQGLRVAAGDILVLLNNDTLVPPGWLVRLVAHVRQPEVGLVGPATNRIGNEAEISVSYQTYGEFLRFAQDRREAREGQQADIRMVAMFCVGMRRGVYERVGPLDERFEIGMFEDDDYVMRVREAGFRVVCAEDTFVHHFGEASLGRLVPTGEYARVFEENRRRFEQKWGTRWQTHPRRTSPAYHELAERVQEVVRTSLPEEVTILVVSKGDEQLLDLGRRRGWHFPQDEDGAYSGHYPANSGEAIAHLEALRGKGADFLLVPSTGYWWLDFYADFARYLESRYGPVQHQDDSCVIFALRG